MIWGDCILEGYVMCVSYNVGYEKSQPRSNAYTLSGTRTKGNE